MQSTTFNITNIVPNIKEMTMAVFYEFSNGNVFSNIFPATTPVTEILGWGQDKCKWFDDREEQIRSTQEELLTNNQIIEE